jgi:hypothetical protein
MKISEIKKGETYLCTNGAYRRILFTWPNGDVAYAAWMRDKAGQMVRKTWIAGNCTIKHFARWAVSKVSR